MTTALDERTNVTASESDATPLMRRLIRALPRFLQEYLNSLADRLEKRIEEAEAATQ